MHMDSDICDAIRRTSICLDTFIPERFQHVTHSSNEDLFFKVMRNTVLLNEISSHLSVRELLQLSVVSKLLCETVRYHILPHRLRLTLCYPNYVDLDSIPPLQWRSLALQVDGWKSQDISKIAKLIENVTSVELVTSSYVHFKKCEAISTADLTKLILAPRHLDSLALSGGLICRDLSTFFTGEIKKTIRHLTEFKLINELTGSEEFYIEKHPTGQVGQKEAMYAENFYKNMLSLLNLAPFKRLRSFSTRHFHIGPESAPNIELKNLLIHFILVHRKTLEKIDVDWEVWTLKQHELHFGAESIRTEIFPNLKYIRADSGNLHTESISEFVRIQPALQYFVFNGSGYPSPGSRHNRSGQGKEIFDTVAMMNHTKMKKLELRFLLKLFSSSLGGTTTQRLPLSWHFLRDAKQLDTIRIEFWSKRVVDQNGYAFAIDVSTILKFVPSQVQHITIQGVSEGKPKVELRQTITNRMMSFFPRFTNLLTLNLFKSPNALNDSTLQAILKHLPKLRVFGFSHCDRVTNFGITGIGKDGKSSKYGIQNLTDLEQLTIAECPQLNKEILHFISFVGLRNLTMAFTPWCQTVWKDEEVLDLILLNPAMEILRYNGNNWTNLYSFEKLSKLLKHFGKEHVRLYELCRPDHI